MKWKNISPLEQHAEKLVLAVAVLFFAYVLWAFVISDRYTTELGGQEVTAAEIDRELYETAQRQLASKLDGEPFFEPEGSTFNVDSFQVALLQPLEGLNAQLRVALGGPGGGYTAEGGDPGGILAPLYAIPEMPAPHRVGASHFYGTIDPTAPLPAELIEQLPPQAPLDYRWVSVAGLIDTSAIREAYTTAVEGRERIDPQWMERMFRMMDLQVERRTQLADGTWSEPELVPAPPGYYARLRDLATNPPARQELLTQAQTLLTEVNPAQVPFYSLEIGAFAPPLEPLPEDEAETEAETTTEARRPTARPMPMEDPMGRMDTDGRFTMGSAGRLPLLSGEELLLYTHDLTTEPDRVYQYRMRLAVMNPLYGRTDLNDNQEAADQALLYSPWSQWTEQVQTRGMRYLFVTGGSKSTRTATVQVWKFHNGQWINGTFRVNAGDPVGTTVTSASLIGGGQALLDPTGADLSTELDAVDIGFEEREIFAGTETTSTRLLTVGGGGELAHHIEALDTARMQKIREDLQEAAPQLAMQEEDRRPDEMEEPWEGEGRFDRDRRRDDRFRDDRRRMEMEDLEPDGGRYRGEGE